MVIALACHPTLPLLATGALEKVINAHLCPHMPSGTLCRAYLRFLLYSGQNDQGMGRSDERGVHRRGDSQTATFSSAERRDRTIGRTCLSPKGADLASGLNRLQESR